MFDPIYSLPAAHWAKGSGFGGTTLMPGSTGYADFFKRDRAPTATELLSHLVGVAYRCVNLNSNLVASTRLRLYLKTAKGEPKAKFVAANLELGRRVTAPIPRKRIKRLLETCGNGKSALLDATESGNGEVEEVTEHPLLDVLRQPEDTTDDGGLSAYDHRWLIQCLLESVGAAYLYVSERNESGQPKRLQILRSQLVRPVPDPTGKRYILRYEYGAAKIDPTDIIRFALPDPANPHFGVMSPMRAAIEKVRLARGDDAFTTALLENGGYPAGIWSPKGDSEGGGIGDAIARRMSADFRRAFAMANAGKIFVSESPGTLQTLAWKPTEIIDVERARELAGQIADCFDVPRTKIFRDSSNRASGEQGDVDHARDAGISRCSRFEEVINGQLVPLFDDSGRLFVAFDSPVKDDRSMILEEAKTGAQLGLTTIDEGRSALGMDPLDDELGGSRLVPGTLVLLGEDGEAKPLVTPPEPAPAANSKPQPQKPKKTKIDKALLKMARAVNQLAAHKFVESPAMPPKRETAREAMLRAGYTADEADAEIKRAKAMQLAGSL